MSNSHLIPTPIVDKNGKSTTVRRKPITRAPASALTASKPTAEPSPQLIDGLSDTPGTAGKMLKVALTTKARKLSPRLTEKILSTLHPDTLSSLEVLLARSDRGWFNIQEIVEKCAKERTMSHLNNLALYQHVFEPRHPQSTFHNYICGLQAHIPDSEPPTDYSFASEAEQKQGLALLQTAMEIGYQYTISNPARHGRGIFIDRRNLIQLILERPDDAPRIVDLIHTRPDLSVRTPDDMKHLVALLEQDAPKSLMDGLL